MDVSVDLRLLRYFVAVSEELHFGRAAERLHMTQSPLSRAIRELERELGLVLFVRTTRRVELTAAGSILLERSGRAPAGMRTVAEVETAFDMVTVRADRAIGGEGLDVTVGAPADLIVFEAATTVDVLRNLPGKRTVFKKGRIVGGLESNSWVFA